MHKSHKKKKSHRKSHHQRCSLGTESERSEKSDTEYSDQVSVSSLDSTQPLTQPYLISSSETMGRFIVAARDFRPGSLILSELPLVVGPCSGSKPVCLGCYAPIAAARIKTGYRCKGCNWPMCGSTCTGLYKRSGHSLQECTALRESGTGQKLDVDDFIALANEYNAIVPLRCLLFKKYSADAWRTLHEMESHNALRRKLLDVWNTNQVYVVDLIRLKWGMSEYSDDEIHTICGILEVNAFEVGHHGVGIRALYPTAFLLAHDCVPNTNHTDEEVSFQLNIRASTCIARGQLISLSYAHTLLSTMKRRESLLENKFFLCQCTRCRDPTELGTFASALKCPKCHTGLVLATDPLDPTAAWTCNNTARATPPSRNPATDATERDSLESLMSNSYIRKPHRTTNGNNKPPNGAGERPCPGYTVTAKSMEILMNRISDEIDQIDCNDVIGYEAFLKRYCNVLHPNHYHCLGVKHSLSQLYGKIPGYMIHQLSVEALYRKLDICREILQIFNVLEPGYSRLRGITLYEIHAPLMILATRDFESKQISRADLRIRLKEIVRYLEEAYTILILEPKNSSENLMAEAAQDALNKIRNWQKFIGKI